MVWGYYKPISKLAGMLKGLKIGSAVGNAPKRLGAGFRRAFLLQNGSEGLDGACHRYRPFDRMDVPCGCN